MATISETRALTSRNSVAEQDSKIPKSPIKHKSFRLHSYFFALE